MDKQVHNILIVNLHSAHNLGDEAIMRETLRGLSEAFPDARITLAANHPESWSSLYPGVKVVRSLTGWILGLKEGRWQLKPLAVLFSPFFLMLAVLVYRLFGEELLLGNNAQRMLLHSYYTSDLVLSCGGGNFSAYRVLSPFFLWGLLALAFAQGLGKEVTLLPQSIGPITGQFQRWLARAVFRRARLVMVREAKSQAYLTDILKLKNEIILLPDLAFGLPEAPDNLSPDSLAGHAQVQVGVTLMDRGAQTKSFVHQQEYEQVMYDLLRWLIATKDAHIYFMVQCSGPSKDHDDRGISNRLVEALIADGFKGQVTLAEEFPNALEIKSAYARMDLVIGTRMHTGIFALSSGIPTLLIGYQPKTFGVMAGLGLERYCLEIEALGLETIKTTIEEMLNHSSQFQSELAPRLARHRSLLRTWPGYLKGGASCNQ